MPLVQVIAVLSLIYASLATIRQNDTKAVIAYSSVAHMAVVMLGLFSNTIQGIEGAILLSLAHGFVSPALFVCCGGIIYNRTHSRVIVYHRGLAYYMPVFTGFFLIFTLFNTGIPLSLNFAGEIMSLMGTWFRSPLVAVLGGTGIVLSACYSIFFFNRISYGSYSQYLQPLKDVDRREFSLLLSFLIPTLLLGIFPNIVLDGLHLSSTSYLYSLSSTIF
jgi:NADH-ubiquinone oxidoreductase chain 4